MSFLQGWAFPQAQCFLQAQSFLQTLALPQTLPFQQIPADGGIQFGEIFRIAALNGMYAV
jgi:hypothetical protein